jgi:hypothetical protein
MGGQFRIIESKEKGLALIRYEKGMTNMELPYTRWFRSVIWNMEGHFPVSISPPKATTTSLPYSVKEEATDLVWSEFLDGFMINCFYVKNNPEIHIASRSKLDASGTFYSSKSFRQLFMEAFLKKEGVPLEDLEGEFQREAGKWMPAVEGADSVSYSFLVQHKENRIVSPIQTNRVVLIQKHVLDSNGFTVYDHFTTFGDSSNGLREFTLDMKWVTPTSYLSAVQIPASTNSIDYWVRHIMDTNSWEFQGLVCKDAQGNRWRFRSDKYLAVKVLRGNCPSSLERFSQLYTQNLVQKYLEFYPEDVVDFSLNTLCMNQVIQTLFTCYIQLHVTKTITIDKIDKMFLPHLYNLHGIYLTQLKPKSMKLVPIDIHAYFCKQPWQRIAFLIRKNKEAYFQATQ